MANIVDALIIAFPCLGDSRCLSGDSSSGCRVRCDGLLRQSADLLDIPVAWRHRQLGTNGLPSDVDAHLEPALIASQTKHHFTVGTALEVSSVHADLGLTAGAHQIALMQRVGQLQARQCVAGDGGQQPEQQPRTHRLTTRGQANMCGGGMAVKRGRAVTYIVGLIEGPCGDRGCSLGLPGPATATNESAPVPGPGRPN